jgi:hypothetical protein
MEPLRLFATLQTLKPLASWTTIFTRAGWQTTQEAEQLTVTYRGFSGALEQSEPGVLMLRGEIESLEMADRLSSILREAQAQYQIDLFEEDGRLLRRLTNDAYI